MASGGEKGSGGKGMKEKVDMKAIKKKQAKEKIKQMKRRKKKQAEKTADAGESEAPKEEAVPVPEVSLCDGQGVGSHLCPQAGSTGPEDPWKKLSAQEAAVQYLKVRFAHAVKASSSRGGAVHAGIWHRWVEIQEGSPNMATAAHLQSGAYLFPPQWRSALLF